MFTVCLVLRYEEARVTYVMVGRCGGGVLRKARTPPKTNLQSALGTSVINKHIVLF